MLLRGSCYTLTKTGTKVRTNVWHLSFSVEEGKPLLLNLISSTGLYRSIYLLWSPRDSIYCEKDFCCPVLIDFRPDSKTISITIPNLKK